MDLSSTLMYLGLFLVLAGAIINIVPRSVAWFGKLPGDGFRTGYKNGVKAKLFRVPVTSVVLVSTVIVIGILVLRQYFPPR